MIQADSTWTGRDEGTTWSDPNNWQGGAVPPSGAAVIFPAIDSEQTSTGVFYPPSGTINIDSADVKWNSPASLGASVW